jgi:uroporphyrinogen-III synthase
LRILVTRPIRDGERLAPLLKAMGHQPLLAPLMAVRFLDAPLDLTGVQAILATSANGVRALARLTPRRDLALFAVGPQTAGEAHMLGFAAVKSADGDARLLAEAVSRWARPDGGALLHAAGEDASEELMRLLSRKAFRIIKKRLYRVESLEDLSHEATQALQDHQLDAALFFSPKSAAVFARCVGDRLPTSGLIAICISENTARSLDGLAFAEVRIARAPNQEALLACL